MSLRTFHLLFILLIIIGADVFGVWAIRAYRAGQDPLMLGIGAVSILGGLGLIWYAYRFVMKLDRAHVE